MATYAIGDVQGCFASLQALLAAIDFDRQRDCLWFAGDLVNRGPQSLAVLRFVKDLGAGAVTVLGNHDLHLLAVAHKCASHKKKDTLKDVLTAPDRDTLLTWLRHQPLLHHDPAFGVTLVHAGLPPQWTLATAQAHAAEVAGALRGPDYLTVLKRLTKTSVSSWRPAMPYRKRLEYTANCLTRLRYCDADGRLALAEKGPPGTQAPPYQPWFAIPQRAHANLRIVFGHWAALGPWVATDIYPLDTGCVWGGTLTALCLETGKRTSIPSVEAAAAQGAS